MDSDVVESYKKATDMAWKVYKNTFQNMTLEHKGPYVLGLYFVRDSARRFDYINACQVVCDQMVKYEWLVDDDTEHVKPLFLGTHKDPKNAGVYICLIDHSDLQQVIDKYIILTETK